MYPIKHYKFKVRQHHRTIQNILWHSNAFRITGQMRGEYTHHLWPVDYPHKGPVMWNFYFLFRLVEQAGGKKLAIIQIETPWRLCDAPVMSEKKQTPK